MVLQVHQNCNIDPYTAPVIRGIRRENTIYLSPVRREFPACSMGDYWIDWSIRTSAIAISQVSSIHNSQPPMQDFENTDCCQQTESSTITTYTRVARWKAKLGVETRIIPVFANTIKIDKESMLLHWRVKYVRLSEVTKDGVLSMKQVKGLRKVPANSFDVWRRDDRK